MTKSLICSILLTETKITFILVLTKRIERYFLIKSENNKNKMDSLVFSKSKTSHYLNSIGTAVNLSHSKNWNTKKRLPFWTAPI